MANVVVGLFNRPDQARSAVRHLEQVGFDQNAVGLVIPDSAQAEDVRPANESTEGSVAGGVIGGSLGAILAATGALIIPGIGPFITGGILATLIGGTAGWLVGGLAGMGVSKEEAQYYEDQVQSGRSLVTVRTSDREDEAARIIAEHGGELRPGGTPSGGVGAESQVPVVQGAGEVAQNAQDSDRVRTDLWQPTPATSMGDNGTGSRIDDPDLRSAPAANLQSTRVDPRGGVERVGDAPYQEPQVNQSRTEPERLFSSADDATDDNPVPLSSTDPVRRTGAGFDKTGDKTSDFSPAQDDANPYGRSMPNQSGAPVGGRGVIPPEEDPRQIAEAQNSGVRQSAEGTA